MQTSAAATRISALAQAGQATQNTQTGQFIVDDWRLRGWSLSASGDSWAAPTSSYAIAAKTSAGAGTVETAGTTALVGSGTDFTTFAVNQPINVSGETVRYIASITDATNLTVTTAFSTTASGLSYTVGIGETIQKSSVDWDLGNQDLGSQTPVLLPDGTTTGTCTVSSVALSATEDLICYYANRLRKGWKAGIYVQRVVTDGSNLYWGQPIEVSGLAQIDDANEQSQKFITFPRIQTINSEYWILALQCELQGSVITYHLCYFRSADGVTWSDREFLAGISGDADQANTGINSYLDGSTPTAFSLADLKDAYLQVDGNSTYIISNGGLGNFVCGSTSLVGVTNSSKRLDVTSKVERHSLSLPTAPTAGQGSYTVSNPAQVYNDSSVLIAGARLLRQNGYVTSSGNELITVATELIDDLRQPTQVSPAVNRLELTSTDYAGWLRDWKADQFWEWFSPRQATYDEMCSLEGFTVLNGNYVVSTDAVLSAYMVDTNAPSPDDLAILSDRRVTDGSMEVEWQITVAWADHYAGIILQADVDNPHCDYWAVLYNGTTTKFELWQATPSSTAYKYLTYSTIQQSAVVSLSLATNYYLKVTQYHNRVVGEYSTDRENWTKVIDYTGITTKEAYWGIVGRSTGVLSSALGNTSGSGGGVAMDDTGNPKWWATRFTTGSYAGILHSLAILAGQTATPPQLNVGVGKDNGSGTAPADLTDPSNILWAGSIPSNMFGDTSYPSWGQARPDIQIPLTASTYYWIFFYFDSALAGGQAWNWYTDDGTYGNTFSSSDGSSWSTVASKSAAVCAFVVYDKGSAQFSSLYYSSGENVQTIEKIAKEVAAKGWVLSSSMQDFLTDSDLTAGWQPSAYGKFGDFVLETDVSGANAEVYFRAQTRTDATTGYKLVMGASLELYKDNALVQTTTNLQTLGTDYHLQLVCWTKFVYIWVNYCLAGIVYDPDLTTDGYFGVGVATFSNLRIPDLSTIKEYYSVEIEKSAQSVLEDLTSKIETKKRYTWFIRYDGSLCMGSFPHRSSVATYSASVQSGQKVDSVRYSISQLCAVGDYYSEGYDADELDRRGKRRFARVDYTDARSNAEAYAAGKLVFRHMKELGDTYTAEIIPADFALEREDRITITNPLDGVNTDYIVNDIEFSGELGKSSMKLGLRKFQT